MAGRLAFAAGPTRASSARAASRCGGRDGRGAPARARERRGGAAARVAAAETPPGDAPGAAVEAPGAAERGKGKGPPTWLAALAPLVGLAFVVSVGLGFRETLMGAWSGFEAGISSLGFWGYPAYVLAFATLEVILVPAIPLTMSAGVLFGVWQGAVLTTIAGTLAATTSCTIARFVARSRVQKLASAYPQFRAIDAAVTRDAFRVVMLLRLSPLIPQSNLNWLFGLTSVNLRTYAAATFVGFLPFTFVFVSAGAVGRQFATAAVGHGSEAALVGGDLSIVLFGAAATVASALYVGVLARNALKDVRELKDIEPAEGAGH